MAKNPVMKGERIENLLTALLLQAMKGSKMADKVEQLSVVGFTNVEIADILQTSTGAVAQALYSLKVGKKNKGNANS